MSYLFLLKKLDLSFSEQNKLFLTRKNSNLIRKKKTSLKNGKKKKESKQLKKPKKEKFYAQT